MNNTTLLLFLHVKPQKTFCKNHTAMRTIQLHTISLFLFPYRFLVYLKCTDLVGGSILPITLIEVPFCFPINMNI